MKRVHMPARQLALPVRYCICCVRVATHLHAVAHSEALSFRFLSPATATFPILLKRLLGGMHCPWLSFALVCVGVRWCRLP